jgi:hypothetical protein
VINFAKNPRAILEIDNGFSLSFIDPLTREVQLLVIQDGVGGHLIDWSADIRWSDGDEPEQNTAPGSITLYRFDFEEALGYYIGWVVAMDALPGP